MLPSWWGFWYTEMEKLTHLSINNDRWQEVTVRTLSTSTDGGAK